jgi:hypothetical protein
MHRVEDHLDHNCATRQTLAAVTGDTVDGAALGSLAPVKVTGGNPHITVSAGLCGVQHEASRWRRSTFPGQPASYRYDGPRISGWHGATARSLARRGQGSCR